MKKKKEKKDIQYPKEQPLEDSQPWPGLRHHCSNFPKLVSCELLRVPRTGVCG